MAEWGNEVEHAFNEAKFEELFGLHALPRSDEVWAEIRGPTGVTIAEDYALAASAIANTCQQSTNLFASTVCMLLTNSLPSLLM